MNYETIIGLEVHAQLKTESKMFCRCSADYAGASPNTHVCPVCLGMPGVLPVVNKKAVEFTAMTGLALNCHISEYTKFDRKNYHYPDLMKGYQISQYDQPIAKGGYLDVDVEGQRRRIGVTRVHLEEDVAKMTHRSSAAKDSGSLVDVNRSGVPLMEVVSEPDMRTAEEARQYLISLRNILRYLDVSTANMEEGSFRCDANISVRPVGETKLFAKIEVKNMNSFRAVYRALEYEAKRQVKAVEAGQKLTQETRGWDDAKGVTFSQRSKEFAHDYRYFPEPDLPPLTMSREAVAKIKAKLPELPEARLKRFTDVLGLPLYDASLLVANKEMADYEEAFIVSSEPSGLPKVEKAKLGSNWLLGEVSRILNAKGADMVNFQQKVSPENLGKLAALQTKGVITAPTAKTVLEEMFESGKSPDALLKDGDRAQISDSSIIEDAVNQAVSANPQAVADFRAGKEQAAKFLLGQVMRLSKGRANPQMVSDLIKKKLEKE